MLLVLRGGGPGAARAKRDAADPGAPSALLPAAPEESAANVPPADSDPDDTGELVAFRVYGRVVSAGARPVLRLEQAWDGHELSRASARDGRYRLDYVPGRYLRRLGVVVEARAGPIVVRVPLLLDHGVARRLDLVLGDGAVLRGRVHDEQGRPRHSLHVGALPPGRERTDSGHPRDLAALAAGEAVTDAEGRFQIWGLEAGAHRVVSLAHDWASDGLAVHEPGDGEIFLTVRPCMTLDIEAVDARTGAPVPEFRVVAPGARRAWTGTAGRLRVRDRRPSEGLAREWGGHALPVRVEADGYIPLEARLVWTPGWAGLVNRWVLGPERAVNLRVVLRDASGVLFPGGVRALYWAPQGDVPRKNHLGLAPDGRGVWRGVLPPGRWWLSVWPADALGLRLPTWIVEARPDELEVVELRLPASGRLRLRLPAVDGKWMVSLLGEGLRTVSPAAPGAPTEVVLPAGTAVRAGITELGPIPAGHFRLTVRSSGEVLYDGPLEIPADGTAELDLRRR